VTAALADELNAALLAGGAQLGTFARRARTDPALRAGATEGMLLRPGILSGAEHARLGADLTTLTGLLAALPRRLFGGDVDAMAEALGFPAVQRAAIEATWPDEVRVSRTDLMRTAEGFQAVEVNLHSSLGGLDSGPWHRAYLGVPAFADFAAAHRLTYLDPLDGVAGALRSAARRRGLGAFPRVALVDWPTSYPNVEARLHRLARLLSARGFDAFACHAGQLGTRDGRLHAGDRPIDIFYRIFVLEHVSQQPGLLAPLLAAHRAGTVLLVMGFGAELLGNKGTLALLSANADAFEPAERDAVRRLVPWTRFLRAEHLADAAARRADLILKPVGGYGARGIVAGWAVTDAAWRAALAGAAGRPWILQRRVRAVPERVPVLTTGGVALGEVDVNWGAFVVDDRYSGMMIRAVPAGGAALISTSTGALIGGCFSGRH
jgi:hypothetical protein